jgi:hypothetical protein
MPHLQRLRDAAACWRHRLNLSVGRNHVKTTEGRRKKIGKNGTFFTSMKIIDYHFTITETVRVALWGG